MSLQQPAGSFSPSFMEKSILIFYISILLAKLLRFIGVPHKDITTNMMFQPNNARIHKFK